MNRSNVWTLCAAGDIAKLAKALAAAPASVNVAGWSYATGARCGLQRDAAGGWRLASGAGASAVRLLHIAALTGSEMATQLVLEAGADALATVDGVTADCIAQDCGYPGIAGMIQAQQRRQTNKIGAVEDDEEVERSQITAHEAAEFERLEALFTDGVVSVNITFRSGASTTHHVVKVPRYISCKSLQNVIEMEVGHRSLISFSAPVAELSEINRSDVLRLAGTPALRCIDGNESSDSDDETKSKTRTLALRPRTIPLLLHLKEPHCVARPLALHTPMPMGAGTVEMNHSFNESTVSKRLHEISASQLDHSQRIEEVRKLVYQLETSASTTASKKLKTHLTSDEAESLVNRLYSHSVTNIRSKKEAHQEYLEEGHKLLWRRRDVSPDQVLPDNINTTVSRLYDDGLAHKSKVIEDAEALSIERAVKPKVVSRTSEEIAEASQRLYKSAAGKEQSITKLSTSIYGDGSEERVLDKAELDALVDSVYTKAVEKKAQAKQRAMAKVTDFKALVNKTKLSKERLAEMAKRLSTKA